MELIIVGVIVVISLVIYALIMYIMYLKSELKPTEERLELYKKGVDIKDRLINNQRNIIELQETKIMALERRLNYDKD